MKKIYTLFSICTIGFFGQAQDVDFTSNFTLDNNDPCFISGSVELTYDDEGNGSYPNTGPFLSYLKLVNIANNDVDVPTSLMEMNGLNHGETKVYSFNNIDLPSQTNFSSGATYRVEVQIDPGMQVFESDFASVDTMALGYTTCSWVGLSDLIQADAFAFLSDDHTQIKIDCIQKSNVIVYDLTGKILIPEFEIHNGMNVIDATHITNGLIMVKIHSPRGSKVYKLIK